MPDVQKSEVRDELPVSLPHQVSLDQWAPDLTIKSDLVKDFSLAGWFAQIASALDYVAQCWICCWVTKGFVPGPRSRISWLVVAKWNPWSSPTGRHGPSLSVGRRYRRSAAIIFAEWWPLPGWRFPPHPPGAQCLRRGLFSSNFNCFRNAFFRCDSIS